ncbi:MAG: SusC/RagA family TonB-linked outer membrane protein [Bacteroidales bacterium]
MKKEIILNFLQKEQIMLFARLFFIGFFLVLSTVAYALQEKTITGQVTGEDNEPIPGVTVVAKGTNVGALTDVDGNYSISVPSNINTLVFSFVGMQTREIAIDDQTTIDVQMSDDLIGLDEVVVIGYGTQQRRDITGSVASISSNDITNMPISRLDAALQGSIPGLDVVATGHNPGDGTQIILRGRRSFSASNEPLFILDGIPFYGDLKDINPYDIASIDVLKDASATAIYGSRGANGVIIITTNRGDVSAPRFNFESYAGPTTRYGRIPYGTGEDYAERGREAFRAAGDYPDDGQIYPDLDQQFFQAEEWENMQRGTWTDYQDMLFQNGYKQKHQLSVDGGTEAVKYNFTGNMFDEEGILPGRTFARYSLRNNLDVTLSDRFNVGTSILLSNNIRRRKSNDGAMGQAYTNSPLGKPFEDDGTPRFSPVADGTRMLPVADYEFDSYRWDEKRWAANIAVFGEYMITDDLKYRINLGTDTNVRSTKQSAGYFSITRNQGTPSAYNNHSIFNRMTYESILSYDKAFNDDHSLSLTAVHGIQTQRGETTNTSVSDLPYERARYHNIGSASVINSVGSGLNEWALLSYVGRVFYGYQGKYMFTGSLRADGASQFSVDNKWGYFPSAAFAWRISEEGFMAGTANWLTNLKLRLSYGVSGNQAIDPYVTQGGTSRTTYAWDESAAFGYRNSDLANRSLKWETTAVTNLGLDFAFIGGKINGNVELYDTQTTDLLMERQLPINTGYSSIIENIGSTRNRGIELGLHAVKLEQSNFRWDSDYSWYLNREEIVELYAGKDDDIGNQWFIGHPIHVYYDRQKIGIWQTDEAAEAAGYGRNPGEIKLLDVDNDGSYTDADRLILGDRQPDFVFQTTQRLSYGNWDLSAIGYLRWGNMAQVGAFNPHSQKRYNQLVFNYWTPDNPTNDYPRPNENREGTLDGGTLRYRDGSFFKLRQVYLGYNIPGSLLQNMFINNARVYFTAENPWYWTKSELADYNMEPETHTNVSTYPALRSFIFGINVSF